MTTIVTRSGKGSALTHAEMDANFVNLNTAKPDSVVERLSSAATTTLSTAVNTNLSIPVAANRNYYFEAILVVQCSSTGGVKVAVNGPASATVVAHAIGNSTSATAQTSTVFTALSTLSSVNFCAVATTNHGIRVNGTMSVGATAGNLVIQFAATTAGQTATVQAGSALVVIEAANV
jgi:hypothetical protein